MSPITINLDGVEAWKGGQLLPVGSHVVKCEGCEEGRSKGGHYELHLTWEAVGGEFAGGSIQDWVQVTEGSMGKVRQLIESCNVQVPSGEFTVGPQMFMGAVCKIIVRETHKPNGDVRSEIVAYARAPAGTPTTAGVQPDFQPAAVGAQQSADDPPPF